MGITEFLAGYITAFISATGYLSVFMLMVMESMVLPVPSEAVMPFAGFLIATGQFSFSLVLIISTLGSITGSLVSYFIGAYGGKPFLNKFGRFFLLNNHDLEVTEKFFQKYGQPTIFFTRFIPVIRHLISLPAGYARMNIFRFSIYTILGASCWNMFLAVCGFYLKQNWEEVMKYSKYVDIAVIALIITALGWFVYKHLQLMKKKK
ncbi:MAG: DedA family protein [Candidatus Margulisbacteria bacterium]|nr:DedA family protein [Candidatus Margulisiibacteriota bacterium]